MKVTFPYGDGKRGGPILADGEPVGRWEFSHISFTIYVGGKREGGLPDERHMRIFTKRLLKKAAVAR